MIVVRRGLCHRFDLDAAQGEAWIRAGLPVIEAAGPDMVYDAYLGWMGLALIAARRFDHDGAVVAYNRALALPGMATRVEALVGLANITAFDGDGVALGVIDRALAAVAQDPVKLSERHKQEAYIRAVRVRVLMNQGHDAEADKEAEAAISLAGGLSTFGVSGSDVELRSDAAQAALLSGHPDRARELLAYTGAGRIAQSPFVSATSMALPDCDETVGLRPDDSAVVEFSIGTDGAVQGAQTMFTRGDFATATVFADAVRHWIWQPEAVAKLPPYYRALIRVELRCSRTGGGMPGVWSMFDKRLLGWAGPMPWLDKRLSMAARATAMRQRSVQVETGGDHVGAGVLLMAALAQDPIQRADAVVQAEKAVALLANADPAHRATAAALRTEMQVRQAHVHDNYRVSTEATYFAAARDPVIAADALAQDTLLLAGLGHRGGHFSDGEIKALNQVADDTRPDAALPLRQIALLRLASLAAHDRHIEEAQALFTRTGLDSEQCSLIGDIPRLHNNEFSNYPIDAQRMGFEGWVKEEYDITADGHTAGSRTVIAYPPFVFVAGAAQIVRSMRYDPSFRPSGKLACSAKAETIKFALPYMH